ncbi:hypothetical protein acsn021_27830 [Anaerocolumna cellulosilytica]|uniref:Uncharacterized protein n=1 Tax=Anaerocolumna cellulosilytica TaxID=433286 RepID=A0A6S6QX57_9FIRM|nr:endolytic transglycosylase MltG [Anaerocolumna cellulosilytica]MBB5197000.1 hypothetical protein [Anaerocolumna cellulosilytica]BCJ95214.1 hypothetical protein acsn021_27830 [Anaerocolumna cellulosilytica]
MKLKYYLRGIGVGILFSTLILTVANQSPSKKTLSDEEIINRAKELGMVEKTDKLTGLLSTPTPTVWQQDTSGQEPDKEPITDEKSVDNLNAEKLADEKEAADNAVIPSVTVEITQIPAPTEEAPLDTEQEDVFSVQKVRVEIKSGMTSEGVAKLLMEKGVIEDAEGFNQYLKQNDYTRDIKIGNYEIEMLSSYKDIADKIIFK